MSAGAEKAVCIGALSGDLRCKAMADIPDHLIGQRWLPQESGNWLS